MKQPTAAKPIRLMIADPHPLDRDGLRSLFSAKGEFNVVAVSGTASQVVRGVARSRPDVLILAVNWPETTGFFIADHLRAGVRRVRLVLIASSATPADLRETLECEAFGFVLKRDGFAALARAVRAAAVGQHYFSPDVRDFVKRVRGRPGVSSNVGPSVHDLTPRELQILHFVARGLGVKEIARILRRSEKTIDNHKAHLMAKLDIHDRVALTLFAVREGLVDPHTVPLHR